MTDTCPECGVSWQGEEIPAESRHHYGGKTHFRRVLGVEYAHPHPFRRYDGISEWRCPDCKARIGRWSGRILEEGQYEPPFGGDR